MSNLVNMALPKPKKGGKKGPPPMAMGPDDDDAPKYPYVLQLSLDDDQIKKLGLALKDFDVDTVVQITARAECTSIHEDDNRGGGKSEGLSFQITDMSLSRQGEDGFQKGWDAAGKPAGKPAGGKPGGKPPEDE